MKQESFETITVESKWTDNDRCVIVDAAGRGVVEIEFSKQDNKKIGYIWNLFVLPAFRKQGVGKHLLQLAEEYIKSYGVEKAILSWDSRDTPVEILEWYKRSAYQEFEFGKYNVTLEKNL